LNGSCPYLALVACLCESLFDNFDCPSVSESAFHIFGNGYTFHYTACSPLVPTIYSDYGSSYLLAGDRSHTSRPSPAQSILSPPLLPVTRHPHCSTFHRIPLAHKRRFRYCQFSDNSTAIVAASAVDGTPLLSSPMVDQHSVVLPSTDMPATTTIVSDSTLSESALPQPHAARNRVTSITAALIAVSVLAGLAACTIMARFAYRRRSSLLRSFRRHRQAEDNLGFVFIEYDNSAWGPLAKHMRKDMSSPSFESGA
jgi:hypothetical protein